MEVLNLLELLEDIIEEGSKLPFGNKVMIDKSKALEILRDVRISLPDEVKQAEWINTERQRIIDDAKEEAEKMIKDTEDYIKQKVADSEITKKAQEIGQTAGSYQFLTNSKANPPKQADELKNTKLIDYDFQWAGKNKKELIEKWGKSTGK